MGIWEDFINSAQAVLQVPTMLVDVATTGASKITSAPIPQIPQTVINAASGQTAPPEVVASLLPTLPDISLPDFSLSSLFPNETANLTKYALYGGAGLLAMMILMRPSPAPRYRKRR